MSNQDSEIDEDDNGFFDLELSAKESNNQRTAVRYIKSDISVSLSMLSLFCIRKKLEVNLMDISSKGIAIECQQDIALRKKISVTVKFKDNKKFIIPAIIVHKRNTLYGIKFNKYNNELGDYLLSSQNDLVFK